MVKHDNSSHTIFFGNKLSTFYPSHPIGSLFKLRFAYKSYSLELIFDLLQNTRVHGCKFNNFVSA